MLGPFEMLLGLLPCVLVFVSVASLSWRLRRTRGAALWIVLTWVVVGVLFVYGPPWMDRKLNAAEYVEKAGKVIDAESGRGMPGVYVIAEGSLTLSTVHTATHPEYRLIVATDSEGNYRIPSTWQYAMSRDNFWLTLFIGRSRHQWAITPVSPGYIGSQDKRYLIPPEGNASVRVFHENSNPPYKWNGSIVDVQTISLIKYDLAPAPAIVYYRLATTGVREGNEIRLQLNHELLDYLLNKVCAPTAEAKVATGIVSNLGDFVDAQTQRDDKAEFAMYRYQRELRALEPEGFEPYDKPTVFRSAVDHPYFQTSNVCKILSRGVAP